MWRSLLCAVALLWSGGAWAATITVVGDMQTDPGRGCSLYLGGDIVPGDTERLAAVLDREIAQIDNYPSPSVDEQIVLCLESPGGPYTEGLDMALLVRDRDITTRILPTGTCLSACALVFMGGNLNTRSGEGYRSSRFMHPTSRLGFHAPALVLPDGDFDRDDVHAAYGVAIEATGRLLTEAEELRMPLLLIENLFTHHGSEFHYVDTLDEAALYRIKLYGYESPELSEAARFDACFNAVRWQFFDVVRSQFSEGARFQTLDQFKTALEHSSRWYQGQMLFHLFDGTLWCNHEQTQLGGGWKDRLIVSEFQDYKNPSINTVYPIWIRLPGPSPLTALREGTERDF